MSFTNSAKKMKRQKGGFTLIEVIMVIVTIAIIAALALPAFINL